MGQERLGEVYNATETKMDRNLRAFIDFMSLELEVPTICLVTGGVSVRRDRRYILLWCFLVLLFRLLYCRELV
jgi:hypothetical protein